MKRGDSMEFVGNHKDGEISVTAWKDNKTVTMALTFAGEKTLGKVMRYDRTKNCVEIIRSHVIEEYNKHMGGVDLLDSIIARHKILMRSKKWRFLLGVWTVNSPQSHIVRVYDAGHGKSGVFHSAEWHDGDWSSDGIREAWLWFFIWVESF
ncbi:piggyBac transposable element-derived protein 3 [Trichonephila clavipes]|nr:piggyBac transposable element-derived protein 3 [Trichonephila clavipes]